MGLTISSKLLHNVIKIIEMKFLQKLLFVLILLCAAFVFSKEVWAGPYEDCIARGNTPTECRAASGTWYVQPPEVWNQKVFQSPPGEMFKERFVLSILGDIAISIGNAVGGVTTVAQGPNGPVYVHEGGAANIMASVVTNMTVGPPVSSVEYLADLGQNLGIVKPAYAQGIGFSAFSSLLVIWKSTRNIAYLAFVVIFVIIGFMIMFRKKIDPRTVVTIQDSLPRIVVALILVTFSYAIVGLIVDLGAFSTRLIGETLKSEGLLAATVRDPLEKQRIMEGLYKATIFELINPLRDVEELTKNLAYAGIPGISELAGIPILSHLTVRLIFWLAGLFIMFKIFFALIAPYVSIILSVIFAPFQLMLGALPGGENSATNWLRSLVANVAVFPVTFVMLAIAAVIKGYTKLGGIGGSTEWGVLPGKYEIPWYPAVIGNWGTVAGDLVAFGILFTIPRVVQIVQEALQIKPSPWMAAAGEEIKMAAGKVPVVGGYIARQI